MNRHKELKEKHAELSCEVQRLRNNKSIMSQSKQSSFYPPKRQYSNLKLQNFKNMISKDTQKKEDYKSNKNNI